MSCLQSFNNLCQRIVCPTRHNLNEDEMIERKFKNSKIIYFHFHVSNSSGKMLSAIVFPKNFQTLPTVLYLHGNGGHKLQCLQLAKCEFNLVSFDFQGCGKSQGDYVTYGEQEVEDVKSVLSYVQSTYKVRKVVLWGRSMGASIALMFSSLCPTSVHSMILDSPFRTLRKVVENVADHTKKAIPKFIISIVIYLIYRKLYSTVEKDIFESDFLMHLNLINNIPILFAYSINDSVVREEDVRQLYEAYLGRKSIMQISSLHHQDRPKQFINEAVKFVYQEQSINSKRSRSTNNCKTGIGVSTKIRK